MSFLNVFSQTFEVTLYQNVNEVSPSDWCWLLSHPLSKNAEYNSFRFMVTVFLYCLDSAAFPVIEKKYPEFHVFCADPLIMIVCDVTANDENW